MKRTKKFLGFLLALSMSLAFTACSVGEKKKTTVTVDEAEQVVEDLMEVYVECDFETEEAEEFVTENFQKQGKKEMEKIKDDIPEGFLSDGDNENGKDIAKKMMDFDYEIKSSEEKDGKVIVEVEATNKDYSFITDLIDINTREEVVAYLKKVVSKGLMTEEEAEFYLYATELSDKEMLEFYDILSGGETVSATLEFTVIKDGEKAKIDEIDSLEDFFAVIMLNITDTL